MRYEGRFERPAGMIYDVWDEGVHVTADRPTGTEVAGLDFGAVHTAACVATLRPGSLCYVLTRFYQAGSRTAAEHADQLAPRGPNGDRPAKPSRAWGGAASEDNWRREFTAARYPVAEPPVRLVEVGIDRAYALLKNHPGLHGRPDPGATDGAVIVHDPQRPWVEAWEGAEGFADFKDEVESYSRELDDDDEPTEKIEDKSRFHLLDAFRYLSAGIVAPRARRIVRPGTTIHRR